VKERADLRSTEETGADRPAAPISHDDDPELAEHEADLERAEREYQDRIATVIESDDKLAAAAKEIQRLAALYAAVARERDRSINEQTRLTRLLKSAENKIARLEREIEQLRKRGGQ
jgi:chromosome segregation ATPase